MKILENVYRLDATPMSYVYLIKGEETVLIDTCMPFAYKGLLRELEALTPLCDIRHILITHHDIDHIGNAAALQKLTGACVWAPAGDIPYITGEKPRHSFKKYLGKIFRAAPPENMRPLVPGESVAGVRAVPTPGHTPGHTCFMYGGVLFAGDLIENKKHGIRPYPAPWDWDYEKLLASVKGLAAYDFERVCPSHGQPFDRSELEGIL